MMKLKNITKQIEFYTFNQFVETINNYSKSDEDLHRIFSIYKFHLPSFQKDDKKFEQELKMFCFFWFQNAVRNSQQNDNITFRWRYNPNKSKAYNLLNDNSEFFNYVFEIFPKKYNLTLINDKSIDEIIKALTYSKSVNEIFNSFADKDLLSMYLRTLSWFPKLYFKYNLATIFQSQLMCKYFFLDCSNQLDKNIYNALIVAYPFLTNVEAFQNATKYEKDFTYWMYNFILPKPYNKKFNIQNNIYFPLNADFLTSDIVLDTSMKLKTVESYKFLKVLRGSPYYFTLSQSQQSKINNAFTLLALKENNQNYS